MREKFIAFVMVIWSLSASGAAEQRAQHLGVPHSVDFSVYRLCHMLEIPKIHVHDVTLDQFVTFVIRKTIDGDVDWERPKPKVVIRLGKKRDALVTFDGDNVTLLEVLLFIERTYKLKVRMEDGEISVGG